MADRSSLVNPRSRSAVDNDHPVRLPPTATSSASESANLAAAPSTTRVTAPASRPSYSTRYLPANPTHKPSFPPNLPTPSTLPTSSHPPIHLSSTVCQFPRHLCVVNFLPGQPRLRYWKALAWPGAKRNPRGPKRYVRNAAKTTQE